MGMRKTDRVRIFIFSDYPKKSNGSSLEVNFRSKNANENLDEAIKFLKKKKEKLNGKEKNEIVVARKSDAEAKVKELQAKGMSASYKRRTATSENLSDAWVVTYKKLNGKKRA